MKKGVNKSILYGLLAVLVFLLYRKIFVNISTRATAETSIDLSHKFSQQKKDFRLKKGNKTLPEKIYNPFFTRKNEPTKQETKENFRPETVVNKSSLPQLSTFKTKRNISYHGLVSNKSNDDKAAFILLENKFLTVFENDEFSDNCTLKKIWLDSIKVKINDKDTVIKR